MCASWCYLCRAENWDGCVNMQYVGGWVRHTMKKVTAVGVAQGRAERAALAAQVAADITGNEDAVALFTNQGDRGELMWLMKQEGKPWVVPAGGSVTCPISEEKCGEGESVMRGYYYA